jgi:putative ABC transport system permease protein
MKIPLLKTILGNHFQEIPLAVAQLSHQKVRLLVALSGIGFANILIFMQLGFSALLFDGVTRIHEHLKGDLFLVSKRTKYLGDQPFSKRQLYQAASVDGVAEASPFYYSAQGTWVNPETKEMTNVVVIAFNPAQPVMDLPEVNQQLEQIKLPNTVLFDSKSQAILGPVTKWLAHQKTITTELSGRRIKVGGTFTLGSSLFKSGHLITSDWNYLRLFGPDSIDEIHVGIITLRPGADPQTVLKNIQAILPDDVTVMTRQKFVESEIAYWSQNPSGVIFSFGTIMGFIVGVVIVYQVLYSDVNDHLAEYATLKAIGYSGMQLLAVVFTEAIILAVLGFIPGFSCAIGMYMLLGNLTQIPIAMRADVALQVFILTVLMCMISAAIAARKLQSADPADVF